VADSILTDVRKGIGRKPFSETDRQMNQLSALVNKIDLLLSGHTLFRLDRWMEKARRWGHTGEESDYYEADSKRIVTVWGADLSEYSARLWSGLLSDYYLIRWEKWYEEIKKGREFDSRSWELKWVETSQNYRKVTNNNSVEIIKELEDIVKK
jgi:alpha-N-acetylglucosaminidase